jgi:hypothetical protein
MARANGTIHAEVPAVDTSAAIAVDTNPKNGDRFGDRSEAWWTQLRTAQTALQSRTSRQKGAICRVVVPAVDRG